MIYRIITLAFFIATTPAQADKLEDQVSLSIRDWFSCITTGRNWKPDFTKAKNEWDVWMDSQKSAPKLPQIEREIQMASQRIKIVAGQAYRSCPDEYNKMYDIIAKALQEPKRSEFLREVEQRVWEETYAFAALIFMTTQVQQEKTSP